MALSLVTYPVEGGDCGGRLVAFYAPFAPKTVWLERPGSSRATWDAAVGQAVGAAEEPEALLLLRFDLHMYDGAALARALLRRTAGPTLVASYRLSPYAELQPGPCFCMRPQPPPMCRHRGFPGLTEVGGSYLVADTLWLVPRARRL